MNMNVYSNVRHLVAIVIFETLRYSSRHGNVPDTNALHSDVATGGCVVVVTHAITSCHDNAVVCW